MNSKLFALIVKAQELGYDADFYYDINNHPIIYFCYIGISNNFDYRFNTALDKLDDLANWLNKQDEQFPDWAYKDK